MNIENPLATIRQLKGASLSVYIALIIVNQPVTEKWLEAITGYSDKPVSKALLMLKELGYINKLSGQRYVISTAKQLPLMENLSTVFPQDENLSTGYPQNNLKSRNNSDFFPTTTTTLNNGEKKEKRREVEELNIVNGVVNRKNSDFEANYKLLRSYGVGEPNCSLLSDMEWVNPTYIEIMRFIEKRNINMFIHRIKVNDPVPDESKFHRNKEGKIDFSYEEW